jgi:hypothetical protein
MSQKVRSPFSTMILVVIVIMIAGLGVSLYRLSTIGYASAYEGAKGIFLGVYYQDQAYEGLDFRGTTMNFDVDDPKTGLPNVEGEMTTIFIPELTKYGDVPEWVPDSWKQTLDLYDNPVEDEVYEWEVQEEGETHFYRMEKWLTKWYMSFEAGYDTWGIIGDTEGNNKRIRNMEVWFELETKPSWYFEDADRTYFAIAKIQVANVLVSGHSVDKIDITPESSGSSLFLFYEPYGGDPSYREEDFEGFTVDGTHLNPDFFGRTVYTMIELNDFGTQQYFEGLNVKTQSDVVTYEFTVHQFIVGKWIVQDIDDIPPLPDPDDPEAEDGYGRTGKTTSVGVSFNFGEWLRTPNGIAFIVGIVILIIALWFIMGGASDIVAAYVQARASR